MNKNDVEHYRKLLGKRLEKVDRTIRMMKENGSAEQDVNSPAELSNYDNHPAEIATELFQVELNSALKVHEENILKEIKDALKRIDAGVYGICEHCGAEIEPERLEVMPHAKTCIRCEKDIESSPQQKFKGRANEELVLDAQFGRKYLNKREDDENEGIDQLNDLVKYGTSDSPQDLGGYHDYKEYYTNEIDKQGIVDDMDQISNDTYKRQLPR